MMTVDTAPSCVWHAAQRAWERYRIDLDVGDVLAMAARCRDGASVRLGRQAGGSEWHLVETGRAAAPVVMVIYNPATTVVVTVLPPGARRWRASRARR